MLKRKNGNGHYPCLSVILQGKLSVFYQQVWRCLLLGRKVMTNLDSILKSRDITLPTKVCLVKVMVFPVVKYGCESWTVKKAEHQRIDVFELWCWRSLLRVPWTARRSNQSILKEISPGCSLEVLGRQNREKQSKMAVAKKQGRSKECPKTRVKTSGRTNSTPG